MYLSGSPLGLINVRSRPDAAGKSTFPFDGINIGVARYNQASDRYRPISLSNDTVDDSGQDTGAPQKTRAQSANKSSISIFSRRDRPTRFTPFPSIDKTKFPDNQPDFDKGGIDISRLHSDGIYDTSILNILKTLRGTMAELKASHFAYLKNVGVFPNNRLMIARRFAGPGQSVSNLMKNGAPPLAVLISWVPQDTDFLNISFGEEWEQAEVDFTQILNDLGSDFGKASGGLGDKLAGGLGAIPLPGFTETFQRLVFEKLGIFKPGASSYIPAGEPNLIKEAKRRKLIGQDDKGSGLKCTISIKFVCEWEQKFLSGIDPTIVFLDIIQNLLRFGTSPAVTYGMASGVEGKVMKYVNDPMLLLKDLLSAISGGIEEIKTAITDGLNKAKAAVGPKPEPKTDAEKRQASIAAKVEELLAPTREKAALDGAANQLTDGIQNVANQFLKNIIGKYKIKIEGILRALTGNPSGPWHVTLGNPLRPVFSSGDMVLQDSVSLTLGGALAFNDLPSTIKAEFTLTNARNLGLQEIMARFNSGQVRSVMPFPTDGEAETIANALRIDADQAGRNTAIKEFYGVGEIENNPAVGEQKEKKVDEASTPTQTTTQTNNNTNNNISNNTNNATGTASATTGTTTTTSGNLATGSTNATALNQASGLLASKPGESVSINPTANSKNTTIA